MTPTPSCSSFPSSTECSSPNERLDGLLVVAQMNARGDVTVQHDRMGLEELKKYLMFGLSEFLRPCALFYHALTQIPPPEALKDPSIDTFGPLCRYLGLPDSLSEMIEFSMDEHLWKRWLAYDAKFGLEDKVEQPVTVNKLQTLPKEFSELMQTAAQFTCRSLTPTSCGMPTMCLVCGETLCSQGYCCQKQLGKEQVGACTFHAHHCTAEVGIFLRIRESQVVLQHKRRRGCFKSAPYCDQYGETDQGFRRGNPLFLNQELYKRLEQLWFHHSVPEEVSNQLEMEITYIGIDWVHL